MAVDAGELLLVTRPWGESQNFVLSGLTALASPVPFQASESAESLSAQSEANVLQI